MLEIKVKKTYPEDFERAYPLLQDFDSPFTKQEWRNIFYYDWKGKEDCIGYHLEKDNQIVGFIGLIFSIRIIENKPHKFCNITSLIVKKNYRTATILLLRKLKDYPDTIFIGFGLTNEAYQLYTKLGFVELEDKYKIIPTINCILEKKVNISVFEYPELLARLNGEDYRIATDHHNKKCKSMLFDFGKDYMLVIYSVLEQKHLRFSFSKILIHYISNKFASPYLVSISRKK